MAALRALALYLLIAASFLNSQSVGQKYIGSKACSGCHSAIYQSFRKTGMGRSITPASDWSANTLPAEAAVAQPRSSIGFSVSRGESGWRQTESEPGLFSAEYLLDYAVGSGVNGLTFLIRRGGYLFQAPLSYYSQARKWDLSPGYEKVNLGFSRMVPEECINCHAGRPAPLQSSSGAYADPPFQELAIGCENCHGPGDAHVKSLGNLAGTIVNPAKLAPALADNICLNCHQAGDARVTQPGKTYLDFRPGQWLFDTAILFKQPAGSDEPQQQSDLLEHYSAMQASRCFRASAGKLSCLSCHDPHTQPRAEEASNYYRPKCLACHSEQSCRLPASVRAAQHPPDDCTGCHMPKRKVLQISHSALTNHRIPARDGESSPPPPQNKAEGLVVVNPPAGRTVQLPKPILLRAYQQLSRKNPNYERRYIAVLEELSKTLPSDTFVQAALGDKAFAEDRYEAAVEHLKLALPLGNPAIYLELGQSLAKLGRDADAVEYLKKGVGLNPYNAEMQKSLILEYINLKSYAEARRSMNQYVATFPEDGFMRSLLARVSK